VAIVVVAVVRVVILVDVAVELVDLVGMIDVAIVEAIIVGLFVLVTVGYKATVAIPQLLFLFLAIIIYPFMPQFLPFSKMFYKLE
jgi:hypothetical protein